MTNIIAYITLPILLSVHTNDWVDNGYAFMLFPHPVTNYHQMQIVESNYFVMLPSTNPAGVAFSYEINLSQTLSTNRRDMPTPSAPSIHATKAPSMAGSVQVHRLQIHKISMPPLPE